MEALVNYTLTTNEISLVNHRISGDKFKVDPVITRKIEKIDDSKSAVTYSLEIKNSPEHPFPVDVLVSLTGVFDISNLEPDNIDDFLKVQTCQIIFPQIRTIVATLTSSALMHPILLPVVDARKLLDNEQ